MPTGVSLADLNARRDLLSHYPETLDTECDPGSFGDVSRIKRPLAVETVIKLNAFFRPYLTLHEAQILDHYGHEAIR